MPRAACQLSRAPCWAMQVLEQPARFQWQRAVADVPRPHCRQGTAPAGVAAAACTRSPCRQSGLPALSPPKVPLPSLPPTCFPLCGPFTLINAVPRFSECFTGGPEAPEPDKRAAPLPHLVLLPARLLLLGLLLCACRRGEGSEALKTNRRLLQERMLTAIRYVEAHGGKRPQAWLHQGDTCLYGLPPPQGDSPAPWEGDTPVPWETLMPGEGARTGKLPLTTATPPGDVPQAAAPTRRSATPARC